MPIIFRSNRKVQPHGTIAILLYQQFIKLLLRFFSIVDEDGRIHYRLFIARCANICCATCKMV